MALRVNSGVEMDSVGQKLKSYLEKVLPADLQSRMYITSNFRAGPPYHGDTGSNGALDFSAPMTEQGRQDRKKASEIIMRDAGSFLEVIHTYQLSPVIGYYVKNGSVVSPGFYGSEVPAHYDHIHLAISESSADRLLAKYASASPPPPSSGDSDMSRASAMVEVPRRTGDDAKDARGVNVPRAWFNTVHMHFACDFAGPEGIKIRLAHFSGDKLVKVETITVRTPDGSTPANKMTGVVVPPGVQYVNMLRVASDPASEKAPCTVRVDMFNV